MKTKILTSSAMLAMAVYLAVRASAPSLNSGADERASSGDPARKEVVKSSYGKLPLTFEANAGQTDPQVRYLARGSGYTIFLTDKEAVLKLQDRQGGGAVVRLRVADANENALIDARDQLPGKSNYFIGNDPSKWRTNVPMFSQVRYEDVYPGIDLLYHGDQRQLEYDFVVAPGAEPRAITLNCEGADKIDIDRDGDLVLRVAEKEILFRKPLVYQDLNGVRREVAARYVLKKNVSAGFEVAAYDTTRPLVIDPVLAYSTYLGGTGNETAQAIAVDATGSAYVAGYTNSTTFPTTIGAFQPGMNSDPALGNPDGFITKLNPAGNQFVYSTYLGGSCTDIIYGIAVNAAGEAYVTGTSGSGINQSGQPDCSPLQNAFIAFPQLNAFQGYGGNSDAFVTKLNAAGNALVFSSFLGGSNSEFGTAIAVDAIGDAYVTGNTISSNFPTTPGAFQTSNQGGSDAFVTKVSSAGVKVYSTYLGGGDLDSGKGIAVDSLGNAYVTGLTASGSVNFCNIPQSAPFPTTPGAFQTAMAPSPAQACTLCCNGPNAGGSPVVANMQDAFVTKLNNTGTGLIYSTYLGGGSATTNGTDAYEEGHAVAVDAAGNAYITGTTAASNFPTVNPFQATGSGGATPFVTKLNAAGSSLVYSTYLGSGGNNNAGNGIAVDPLGLNAHVTGSAAVPQVNPLPQNGGPGFVTKFSTDGSTVLYSTGIQGSSTGAAIGLDSLGNAYVTGDTQGFLATVNPAQGTNAGFNDAYVVKIGPGAPVSTPTPTPTPNPSSTTIVVRPSAMNGWATADDNGNGGAVNFVTGPATPPAGMGSLHFLLTAANQGRVAYTTAYNGTRFDQITKLDYSTYRASPSVDVTAVALQFNVDYDLTDANTSYQGRLVFEPYQTPTNVVLQGMWQPWNALAGRWWATGAPGNTLCPQSSPCTWSQVLTNWPKAGIHSTFGAVVLKAGSGWASFDGNADALSIGVMGNNTTYDFEPDPLTCVTPPPNMISWWPGDGNTTDIIGGNNGTWIGTPTYSTGEVGTAFSFNGTNQYVTVGNPPSLQITDQVTIDGWINPSANTNDVVYFGKTAYGDNEYVLIFQFNELTGMIQETIIGSNFVPPLNQWTHIALTYDGAMIKLYVNGLVISSAPKSGAMSTGSEFAIGGRALDPFGRHFLFPGLIDEVEVFHRALSGTEIAAIYNAGSAGKCKPATNLCVNVTCSASDQCHDAGVCDPSTGACSNPAKADGSTCDDGNKCTTSDSCQAGSCTGAPVNVDDGNPCTIDGCDPAGKGTGITHTPVADGASCDDGNACTNGDSCRAGQCRGGPATTCNAPDQCHLPGACDPATGVCTPPAKPDGTACNDGNACTVSDSCQSGACQPGTPVTPADDGNPCTIDTCDPITGNTIHTAAADGTSCSDGNACTVGDSCQAGACQAGAPVNVSDGNACTTDSCDPTTGQISHSPMSVDDGNPCTIDSCDPVTGIHHDPVNVDDHDACTTDACDPATGNITHTAKPIPSDNNACTTDSCDPSTGNPVYTPVDTNDNNACTTDSCDPSTGAISHTLVNVDDHNACTTDACDPATGTITHTAKPIPSDNNACTTDSCDPNTGNPVYTLVDTNDNNACTTDSCDPNTGVISHTPVNIDDHDACTTDACDPATGNITHTAKPIPSDNNACTTDSCDPATGNPVYTPVNINDNNACTTDSCDSATGNISHTPVNIDDHDACTTDACDPATGNITHTAKPIPSDNNACTTDSCDPNTGNPVYTPLNIDDHNACTTDTCNPTTGMISHTPVNVDDSNACTTDASDPATGTITHTAKPIPSDNNACTTDSCDPNTGNPVYTPVDTNDNNACTTDSCNSSTGQITHTPVNVDDGNACTTDACNPTTGAITHTAKPIVSDNNACTTDSCDPATGNPVYTPVNTNDNNACTTDSCNPTTGSISHTPVDIDDHNACTADSCDPTTGVRHTPIAGCNQIDIVFASNRDGNYTAHYNDDDDCKARSNFEIYGMKADGTGVVRLTNNPAADLDPALSPDKTKIVFTSNRDGNYEIYSMNVNGTGVTRLTNNAAIDGFASWSPTGAKIAFTSTRDGNFEIYSMNANGTGVTRLTNNTKIDANPVWSPNGLKIAFTSTRDGNFEIYSMNADGTGITRLTNNAAQDAFPTWSPDSAKIAFMSTRPGNAEIYSMNADGTGVTRLTTNSAIDAEPSWGSNNKIVFSTTRDGNFEIYSMSATGTGVSRLTNNPAWDISPHW